MPDTPQSLADHLLSEGGRVIDFFKQLTVEQWAIPVYPGEPTWDMHHLLAHFVSSEIGRRALILDVLAGGEGAPSDFEIDVFNQQEVGRLSGESTDRLLELFSLERGKLAALVSSLEIGELGRIVNDPYLGKATLSQMIKLTYQHLLIHLRDARRCL